MDYYLFLRIRYIDRVEVFDTDIDTVVKFFIFILIFVFDPMALAMVLAWNTAVGRKTFTEKEFKEPIKQQVTGTWEKIKVEEPVTKTKEKKEWKKTDLRKGGIRG